MILVSIFEIKCKYNSGLYDFTHQVKSNFSHSKLSILKISGFITSIQIRFSGIIQLSIFFNISFLNIESLKIFNS